MTPPTYVNKLLRQDTLDFMLSREHLFRPKLGVQGKVNVSDILPVFLNAGIEYCDRLLAKRRVRESGDISILNNWVAFHFDEPTIAGVANHRVLVSTVELLEENEWRIRFLTDVRGKLSFAELAHKLVIWGGYLLEKEYEKTGKS